MKQVILILILHTYANNDNGIILLSRTQKARDNQKLLKLLSKGFQRSVYWNECETKSDNKNTTNEFRFFLNQVLLKPIGYVF